MLVEKLIEWGLALLNGILNILDVLPDMPSTVVSALDSFFDLIFGNLTVLNFFLPVSYVATFVLIAVLVNNFERIYAAVMWVLRKIPVLGIE